MKRNYQIFLLGLLLSVTSCSFTTNKIDPGDNGKDEVLTELVTFVLKNYHYSPKDIDDQFSKKVYHDYLKNIDPRKRYFLQSDLDEFSKYEKSIDDELKNQSVDFFNLTYNRLQKRIAETQEFYEGILEKPFNFKKNEEINTDYKNLDYSKSEKKLKDRWRKQLKFSTLSTYYNLKQEEKAKAKDDKDYKPKSDAELEKEARKTTRNSLEQYYDLNKDIKKSEWFSVYLNAITNEFDPHTAYFAPRDKERFDIAMSGSLEGIGARLQKNMDDTKVIELISGGPAWKNGELEVGDKIKKVKQEDEEDPVSIVGMPLSDAVELIKGPKGTKVTLTVKRVDGTLKDITLTRDVVEIKDTFAKSAMVKKNGRNFGFINLPSFYFNMKDYDKRNAASDVKKEIDSLKQENMDGLVLDLRNNGGGSLSTAIDIAGMFIKKGPVVQVRAGDDERQVLNDRNPSVEWNGPLVILVNELSASASEILSAAMQDYGRAVIIGSKQTYGKGTVQKLLDLNRFMRNDKLGNMGALKITTQKFYRINGGSTQLKGVHSDVVVPDRYSYIDVGERDMENPLPWDKIEPADYKKWNGYANFDETLKKSQARMGSSKQIQLIRESAKWIRKQRDENVFPLNYTQYKSKIDENEKQADHFKAISDYQTDLTFTSLPSEEKLFKTDTTFAEKRKRWHKNLSSDVYVDEALHVLEDLKLSQVQKAKLAKAKE